MSIVQDAQRFPVTAVMIIGAVAAVLAEASGRSIDHLMLLPGTALTGPWRLVTCVLPHGGPFHLVFNVYWIWMLGRIIESRLGSPSTAVLSLLCAVAASGLEAALMHSRNQPMKKRISRASMIPKKRGSWRPRAYT